MTTSVLHRISFYSVVNGYYQHLELKQLCNRNIDHKHSSQTWLWRLWWSAFLVMSWCLSGEMQLWNSLLLLFSCDLTNMIIITSSYYNDHDQNPSSSPPSYLNHDDAWDKDIGKYFFFRRQCACSPFWDSLSSELKQITWVGATGFRWHLSMQWTHRRHLKGDHGCFVDEISCLCVLWISSLCGFEISVFTLCRDSDVDGAWQEERERFDSAEIHSLVFAGRCHHYGRHDDHHHDQNDDHDDHQT